MAHCKPRENLALWYPQLSAVEYLEVAKCFQDLVEVVSGGGVSLAAEEWVCVQSQLSQKF